MQIIFKTYNLLVLAATIAFTASFLIGLDTFDINLNDSFIMISLVQVIRLFAVALFIFSAIYRIFSKYFYSNGLSWIHIGLTLLLMILLLILNQYLHHFSLNLEGAGRFKTYLQYNRYFACLIYAFVPLQALLCVNLLMGIYKYRSSKKR